MKLSNLSLKPGTLIPGFKEETKSYTLEIPKPETIVSIDGDITDDRATKLTNSIDINSLNIKSSNDKFVIKKLEINVCNNELFSGLPTVDVSDVSEYEDIDEHDDKYVDRYIERYIDKYAISFVNEKSSNNYLSGITVSSGTLTPDFNKDVFKYSMIVENEISDLQFYWTLEDPYASANCNFPNGNVILEPGKNNINIIVTAENGDTRIYSININRIISVQEGNYSYEDPNDCLSEKWGYYGMSQLGDKSGAFLEMYRRIYNAYKYGDTNTSYEYLSYDTKEIYVQEPCVKSGIVVSGKNHKYELIAVPHSDTGLSQLQLKYVYKCVCLDCPEFMCRVSITNETTDNAHDSVYYDDTYIYLPYYPSPQRDEYINKCNDTFIEICSIIKEAYGITFQDKTFLENNAYYSLEDKRRISKVIHDFIIVNSVYGFVGEPTNITQTMYPALSKGDIGPVCASYAKAFSYCCRKFGIHCIDVLGWTDADRDGYHQWNTICYETGSIASLANRGDVWQEVDLTWDDPWGSENKTSEPPGKQYCRWLYYNVTTNELHTDSLRMDEVEEIESLGGTYKVRPTPRPRGRILVENPINLKDNFKRGVYYNYPAEGTCDTNKYDNYINNTQRYDSERFNGQLYYGF